ncbi:hypothetical protein Acsp06_10570 [Actinomycetospora sp. NBRC 106375]|uniref:DUF4188 domain-containing protein n=1 Tax=Actinomycetospora sp. NBRC 106375 TaxID=3032207 RepID=UPI0024A271E9|nr:DUF4188 domain-containing protein [Actinomycetospora sp. NBRC 106375]GLZ44872.1 hypothetical protein Acsp06_10570 [Actinomycetospora sp. NBRC 106375]
MNHRVSAEIEGEFVVFVLGMHINRPTRVRDWLPVVGAMRPMIKELQRQPELGLLRAEMGWMFGGPAVVQYWRSYDQLVAYARSAEALHVPAWRAFNRAARRTDAVGVFHETYRVADGTWETVYSHMPAIGLRAATAGRTLDATSTSASRIGDREHDTAPVPAG